MPPCYRSPPVWEVETEAGGVILRFSFAEGFTSGGGVKWGRRDGTILELTRLVSDQLATWTRHTTNQINQINTLFFWLQVTTHIEEYFHLVLSGKRVPCTLADCPVAFQADL
jgi:hypothetical protein